MYIYIERDINSCYVEQTLTIPFTFVTPIPSHTLFTLQPLRYRGKSSALQQPWWAASGEDTQMHTRGAGRQGPNGRRCSTERTHDTSPKTPYLRSSRTSTQHQSRVTLGESPVFQQSQLEKAVGKLFSPCHNSKHIITRPVPDKP